MQSEHKVLYKNEALENEIHIFEKKKEIHIKKKEIHIFSKPADFYKKRRLKEGNTPPDIY